jgi:hypothetical protein
MQHNEAHEYRQNEALRALARYVRELRAKAHAQYDLVPGDPVAEVDAILGPDERTAEPLEAVLNRTVPTPEQAKQLFPSAPKASSPAAKAPASEDD